MRGLSYRRNQHSIKRNAKIKRFYEGPLDKFNYTLNDLINDHDMWKEYKNYKNELKKFEDNHDFNNKCYDKRSRKYKIEI